MFLIRSYSHENAKRRPCTDRFFFFFFFFFLFVCLFFKESEEILVSYYLERFYIDTFVCSVPSHCSYFYLLAPIIIYSRQGRLLV